jgi:hypothetical protein
VIVVRWETHKLLMSSLPRSILYPSWIHVHVTCTMMVQPAALSIHVWPMAISLSPLRLVSRGSSPGMTTVDEAMRGTEATSRVSEPTPSPVTLSSPLDVPLVVVSPSDGLGR